MTEKNRLLTDGDWETINRKCGFDVLDIIMNLDNRFHKSEQMGMIVKRCNKTAQAQDTKTASIVRRETVEEIFGEISCFTVKLNEQTVEVGRYQWFSFLEALKSRIGE